jgi:hypothetical protein
VYTLLTATGPGRTLVSAAFAAEDDAEALVSFDLACKGDGEAALYWDFGSEYQERVAAYDPASGDVTMQADAFFRLSALNREAAKAAQAARAAAREREDQRRAALAAW